jgi:Zn finger protein HypA/HybF involved in hydrogenase expression
VIAPAQLSACPICADPLPTPRPAVRPPKPHAWVAIRCSFQCRSCHFLSPLDELDIDGSVECAQCGQAQRFDVEAWHEALDFAHAVGDLAFPLPEGRLSHPHIWIGSDNPFMAIGHTEVFAEHRQSSTRTSEGVTIHRSLFIEAAPGHPVCATCQQPLELELRGAGVEATCPGCASRASYQLPQGAQRYCEGLAGVVADIHRSDRRRARIETTAGGPVALKCPECGGALPATREHVLECSYCGTASLIPAPARLREPGAPLTPDIWWLAFRGASKLRAELEEPPPPAKPDKPDKAAKRKAEMTDLELPPEKPGVYLPQVALNLLLPGAALAVAIAIYLALESMFPGFGAELLP